MEVRVLFWAPLPVKTANRGAGFRVALGGSRFEHRGGTSDDDIVVVDRHAAYQHPHIGAPQVGVLSHNLRSQDRAEPLDGSIVDNVSTSTQLVL
ncbi:MAG: hypothetical protein C0476_05695 [Sphingomonas sp.]|nr:hypothetical protein [Sphingomonas sp.]